MDYPYLTPETAYKVLHDYVRYSRENNDESEIENVCNSFLWNFLTNEQKNTLETECDIAVSKICQKYYGGELSPMDVKGEKNKDSAYRLYYYYLTKNLWNKDANKARELAREVYDDILKSKDSFYVDESYLEKYQQIFEPCIDPAATSYFGVLNMTNPFESELTAINTLIKLYKNGKISLKEINGKVYIEYNSVVISIFLKEWRQQIKNRAEGLITDLEYSEWLADFNGNFAERMEVLFQKSGKDLSNA